MAKIAVRRLASGDGWTVDDIVCSSGPADHPYEEQHDWQRIAVVAAGSFQYRCSSGTYVMTPGSILLGNIGQPFECSHEHSNGDRCISFGYAPDYYDRFGPRFRQVRIPAIRSLAPFVAAAFRAVRDTSGVSWEEMSVALAERTVRATTEGTPKRNPASASDVARVIDATRMIEENRHDALSLNALAERAGLSAYHFLRVFERVTGTTPHQYRLRARLRAAALRLTDGRAKVIDVALDSGFGDVSNFNRAFRAEFGVGPRRYRQRYLSSPPRL